MGNKMGDEGEEAGSGAETSSSNIVSSRLMTYVPEASSLMTILGVGKETHGLVYLGVSWCFRQIF